MVIGKTYWPRDNSYATHINKQRGDIEFQPSKLTFKIESEPFDMAVDFDNTHQFILVKTKIESELTERFYVVLFHEIGLQPRTQDRFPVIDYMDFIGYAPSGGEYVVIPGAPSAGKTSMFLNMALLEYHLKNSRK